MTVVLTDNTGEILDPQGSHGAPTGVKGHLVGLYCTCVVCTCCAHIDNRRSPHERHAGGYNSQAC